MEILLSKQVPDITVILVRGAEQIGLTLSNHVVESFLFYITELKKWNRKINLTSLEDDLEIGAKHFLDSLTVSPYVHDTQRVLDIGTGAGFPGLPLKIISPDMELVLLESSQKKVFFLRHIVRGLKLEGIEIVHGRAEDRAIKARYARSFDLVLARALADLPTSLRLALPYIKRGGCVVGMRGKRGEEEAREVDWDAVGLRLIEMRKLTLPFVEESRVLLLLEFTEI